MHPISNYRGWWGCDASATLTMGQKRQKLAQLSLRRVSGSCDGSSEVGDGSSEVGAGSSEASDGPAEVDDGLPLSKLGRFSWR